MKPTPKTKPCPHCAGTVAQTASACPHCGATRTNAMRLFIIVIITLSVGYFVIGAINRQIHRDSINQLLNR